MKLPIPITGYQQSAWEGSINLGTPRGLKITKRLQRERKEEEPFQYINHPPLCILGPAIYIINDSAQLLSLAAITWHVLPDVTLPWRLLLLFVLFGGRPFARVMRTLPITANGASRSSEWAGRKRGSERVGGRWNFFRSQG